MAAGLLLAGGCFAGCHRAGSRFAFRNIEPKAFPHVEQRHRSLPENLL